MAAFDIKDIVQEKMSIKVTDDPEGLQITVEGIIDLQDPGVILDPFFESVHKTCLDKKLGSVKVNLQNLNFLNSSGIKCLAKWVLGLSHVPADKRYKVVIQQNPGITWQKTSLVTLTFAAPGMVTVV